MLLLPLCNRQTCCHYWLVPTRLHKGVVEVYSGRTLYYSLAKPLHYYSSHTVMSPILVP